MLLSVLSTYAIALVAPWLHKLAPRRSAAVLALVPAALTLYFLTLLRGAAEGAVAAESTPWLPAQGVALAFVADGLGALFATVISGAGTVVVLYSGQYLRGHPEQGRFFGYVLAFMASMLGLVLSDDVIGLFVFWELTSITSYLLIGFKHADASVRASALQALLVTAGGGLLLLAGLIMLGMAGGTTSITELVARSGALREHELFVPSLCLIVVAAFTKSAQFPFHFWLPNAMVAPTPVSAYLHSATMVKAGVYLLARLLPIYGGTELWFWLLTISGGVTMLLGACLALQQTDLKLCLAYSTLSVLGALTLLLGDGSSAAVQAAVVLILAHAAYKGALFLVVGCIDHDLHTRDVSALSGLRRRMPITAVAAVGAALSMAGVPPGLGFVSKELLYAANLEREAPFAYLLTAASVLTYALLVAVAGIVGVRPFFGPLQGSDGGRHEPPPSMWAGPLLLAASGLFSFASPQMSRVVDSATGAACAQQGGASLAVWHGPGATFWLSLATLGGGLVAYRGRRQLNAVVAPLHVLGNWGPSRVYDAGLAALNAAAHFQMRVLQPGYLSY
ncbi:MAG TPA: proton-conducting transporter membrane subunit, partial [Polyangiaceae bacterium]